MAKLCGHHMENCLTPGVCPACSVIRKPKRASRHFPRAKRPQSPADFCIRENGLEWLRYYPRNEHGP